MTSQSSRDEYAKRMHRVLSYIDGALDRTLELVELAEIAHFSAFHFHRVFTAWMGETLGEYLRRRRLEVAATRLAAQPRVPVLSIALSVGFGSAEAFARAFKTRFGCTPTEWRKQEASRGSRRSDLADVDLPHRDSNPNQLLRNGSQEPRYQLSQHESSHQTALEDFMKVSVIERQPAKVAYLRHVGAYGESISKFWQNVAYPWMVTNDLLGQPRYGISHDDPGVTAPDQCRYDACVEISRPLVAPGAALTTTIPGGKYAVAKFQGTAGQIGGVWNKLLREWLPASGLQLDARPFFEYYPTDSTYDPKTGIFTCDIAISVAPL
jgi:AraC family transcriptional regulator